MSDAYVLRPYLVYVREAECPEYVIKVAAAMGPRDAENQVREQGREWGIAFDVVTVEEIVGLTA